MDSNIHFDYNSLLTDNLIEMNSNTLICIKYSGDEIVNRNFLTNLTFVSFIKLQIVKLFSSL